MFGANGDKVSMGAQETFCLEITYSGYYDILSGLQLEGLAPSSPATTPSMGFEIGSEMEDDDDDDDDCRFVKRTVLIAACRL